MPGAYSATSVAGNRVGVEREAKCRKRCSAPSRASPGRTTTARVPHVRFAAWSGISRGRCLGAGLFNPAIDDGPRRFGDRGGRRSRRNSGCASRMTLLVMFSKPSRENGVLAIGPRTPLTGVIPAEVFRFNMGQVFVSPGFSTVFVFAGHLPATGAKSYDRQRKWPKADPPPTRGRSAASTRIKGRRKAPP